MNNIKKVYASTIMLIFIVMVVSVHSVDSSAITRNKGFSPSDYWQYTNKTIHFPVVDPYEGYDIWTYEYGGGEQAPTDGFYAMTTDTSGYNQYFGYDEFASQNDTSSETWFRPMALTGVYRFQPLGYFYQKTSLQLSSHWAVALVWSANSLYLYHNTANGETCSAELLASVSPIMNHEYRVLLANSGNDTWVRVYDEDYTGGMVYNGTTTTFNYDATALYAGFGQYSAGDGNVWGRWDNFTIVDSSLYIETIDEMILWGMDVAIIILGLVMIPVSTIYLAYSAKNDRSSDRLFYGLIMFMLGCGLFIGGVLP